jgi:hypothetical protein
MRCRPDLLRSLQAGLDENASSNPGLSNDVPVGEVQAAIELKFVARKVSREKVPDRHRLAFSEALKFGQRAWPGPATNKRTGSLCGGLNRPR